MKKLLPLLLLTIALLVPQYAFAGALSDGCSVYTCPTDEDYYWQGGTGGCYVEIDSASECTIPALGEIPANHHRTFTCSAGCTIAADAKKDWVYDYGTEDLTYTDGNVGIGATDTGGSKLYIVGPENDGIKAGIKINNGSTQNMLIGANEIDALNTSLYLNHNSNYDVVMVANGGNVGIGTDSPVYPLHVETDALRAAYFETTSTDDLSTGLTGVGLSGVSGWSHQLPAVSGWLGSRWYSASTPISAGVVGFDLTRGTSDDDRVFGALGTWGGIGHMSGVVAIANQADDWAGYFRSNNGHGIYAIANKNYFSGRVGIGTDDLGAGTGNESLIINSHIAGTSNFTEGITIGYNGASAIKLGSSTTSNRWGGIVWTNQDLRIESKTNIDFRTENTDRMVIDNGGKVGIGDTTPTEMLEVADNIKADKLIDRNNTNYYVDPASTTKLSTLNVYDGARIEGDNGANSIITFQNNTSNDGGDILSMRGTDFESTAAGSYYIKFYDSDPSGAWGYNGGIRNQSESSVAYATSSDARLKTNIKDYTEGLKTLMNIKAREFEWIEDGSESIGFIAQELQPLFPYAVVGLPDSDLREDYMMIDYGRVTPLLVSAIQEQQQIIEDLNARVTELENK